ncbi:EndoU domain-containing protein [Streptomyces sp. AC627_RSS907]|uniref:EndoU domain-containing protein n=1 Tax=Streptomyces sp. AC627_RSS907 TaxID=2823684 RepID=UPI001C274088|nr:EndoU domain-containing protein [Streptomyces sp. AC627_RSS907]
MPRDLNLIGSAIETAWKDAGLEPGPRDDVPSHLPLDVAERVLRGNPATGVAGLLAPVGTTGRLRPEPLGGTNPNGTNPNGTNPNGTYRAAGGGPDNRPVMMFPEHWSLEEVAAAVEHVHREQLRRGNIRQDGEFEGVHRGVRIRGHALSDGTITDFQPSLRQDDLTPALFADPADEPHPTPFAQGGAPLATHRLWDFIALGDRSRGIGGHLRTGGREDAGPMGGPAVRHLPFGTTTAGNLTWRAGTFALELRHSMYGTVRAPLVSPGPAVALSDGVTGLNTLFPDGWNGWRMDEYIRAGHQQALARGSFTLLPSGGHIWHAVIENVPMHGQVLDGEHQWVRPSWHQSGAGDHTSTVVLAEAHDIEFRTGDGAHYRMNRVLRHNGEQRTEIVRVLHVPRDNGMDFLLESIRGARLPLGDVPGLGPAELRFAIEYDDTGDGPDAELLERAASSGVRNAHTLLGPGFGAMFLSAPRTLGPDQWRPPAGTLATPVWRAATSAVLDLHGPSPLTHEPGVDALVQLHTARELAPHADRDHSAQDLVGATGRLFHPGAGSDLTIPENLRGDWTPDRVRLAALQHSLHARPVEGRQGPGVVVLEAFPVPGVRLEIRHEQGADGVWRIADYTIHTDEGPGVPPLWQPDGPLAEAAAGMGVNPAHLFVLGQELGVDPQDVSSVAALLRGFGDPLVVLDHLDLIADRLGAEDPLLLMRWMSARGIGVEHWWDLAAHLQDRGETLSGLIEAGPDSDLLTSWDQRTQRAVRQDVVAQALLLGVHPRRLEMVMTATLIDQPTVFGVHTRPLWETGSTVEEMAEQFAGQHWRGNFAQMAVQFGAAETAQEARGEFAEWAEIPTSVELPLDQLTLGDLTRAVALWRLGLNDPTAALPGGPDPRPLALLVQRLGMWPEQARVYIDGPGREAGPLPLTTRLEQRYQDARETAAMFTDPATNASPDPLSVLEIADRLGIDPKLFGTIPNLVVGNGWTLGGLLWHGDPAVSADLVRQRLDGLGLDPRELAWFHELTVTAEDMAHLVVTAVDTKNLMVTAEDIERFWDYVADHHTTDEDLAALHAGDRDAGPAAVRKWVEHETAATRGPVPPGPPGPPPGA